MSASDDRDYLVTIRIRNNRILRRMTALGIKTTAELCRQIGRPRCAGLVGTLINMKRPAVRKIDGEWPEIVWLISSALRCEPEDLFNERQKAGAFNKILITFEATEEQLIPLDAPEAQQASIDFIDPVEQRELREAMVERLSGMSRRNQNIVLDCLNFDDGKPDILRDIGDKYDISHERVKQIKMKGLRRIAANKVGNRVMDWKP